MLVMSYRTDQDEPSAARVWILLQHGLERGSDHITVSYSIYNTYRSR